MTGGVIEVNAATAVVLVDLAGALLAGIGPVRMALATNASEDLVEIFLSDQERVASEIPRRRFP